MSENSLQGIILKECWKAHKKKMNDYGLQSVSYSSFRNRVMVHHWSIYRAINTPAKTQFREKSVFGKIKMFFRKLFKRQWKEKK